MSFGSRDTRRADEKRGNNRGMQRTIAVPALAALLLPVTLHAQAPAGELQSLPIQLPKPMFEGTPQNSRS
jgi:hypothetical protein